MMNRVCAIVLVFASACGARTQLDSPLPADGAASTDAATPDVIDESVPITSLPPSCLGTGPGLSDCGVDHDSCCTTLDVPGGTFYRTYKVDFDHGLTGEADPATVSSFRLDKYLVTVARFRKFVDAWKAGWSPPDGSGKHVHLNQGSGLVDVSVDNAVVYEHGWNVADVGKIAPTDAHLVTDGYSTWTTSAADREDKPINDVNWFEAYAFCIWDGGFLPSESEWEYAAAGGDEQRAYPWGSKILGSSPNALSQYAIFDCHYTPNPNGGCTPEKTGVVHIAPVGVTGSGRAKWGHFDLAGDLQEWTLDSQSAYRACTNCAFLTVTAPGRSTRGGDFGNPMSLIHPWYRMEWGPQGGNATVGFRCARAP